MDGMETVLDTGLGDVETDAMSPLASPGNEVSELEQEAVALAAASMEQEDEEDSVTGMLCPHRENDCCCVISVSSHAKQICLCSLLCYGNNRFSTETCAAQVDCPS